MVLTKRILDYISFQRTELAKNLVKFEEALAFDVNKMLKEEEEQKEKEITEEEAVVEKQNEKETTDLQPSPVIIPAGEIIKRRIINGLDVESTVFKASGFSSVEMLDNIKKLIGISRTIDKKK